MEELKNEDKADSLREDKQDVDSEFDGKDGMMERCCGVGRVWIFIVLGVLILVFSAVLTGVYMNVRSVTSSMEDLEVVSSLLPVAVSGLAGLLVLILFWKRLKILVYGAVIMCSAATILCVITAILTGTHVLQPLLSVSACVYNRLDRVCRCATQFRRDGMRLEQVVKEDSNYLTMKGILSCDDVHAVLPGLLFTMVGMYGVVSLVCVVAAVISLLVYRTEKWRKYLLQVEYEDQYIPSLHQSFSDNCAEHHTMLPKQLASTSSATTLINIYTNPRTTGNDEDNSTSGDGNTTPSDLIYSPADIPMGYAEACRMRRCQSFSQPRRGTLLDGSPISSTSSQAISLTGRDKNMGGAARGQGKLKEHRKRERRAVTLHGLDREQLLLILSLQMRYWQESDQSAKREANPNCNNLNSDRNDCNQVPAVSSQENVDGVSADSTQQNMEPSFAQLQRRAMTPTARQERLSSIRTTGDDLDYKPAKLIRSHTPQPHHFKSTNNNSDLQNLPQHQIHPHLPQQQPQFQVRNNDEYEPPTLITYDLRNITKAGPLVYDNIHSARNSLSCYSPEDSCASNNSSIISSLSHPRQPSLTPGLYQFSSLPTPSAPPSPNFMNLEKNKILGVNIQEFEHPRKQFIYQALTSSQSDFENSSSDTRRLIPSEKKLIPEKKPAKNKGKQFLNKEKKDYNTDSEQAVSDRSSGVCGTDPCSSKCGAVADRWKTMMEGSTRQTQTLWENVQKKLVSDPHSPLDLHHPLTSNCQITAPQVGYFGTPRITKSTPKQSNFLAASSSELSHGSSSPQIGQTQKLINPQATADHSLRTEEIPPNMPQHFPVSLNQIQNPHTAHRIAFNSYHQNPHTAHRIAYNSYLQNVFVPIADPFTETLDENDTMGSQGQHQITFLSSDQTTEEITAPPKPPRINGRHMGRFDPSPNVPHAGSDEQLRPKGSLNMFDQKVIDINRFSNSVKSREAESKSVSSSSHPWKNYMGPNTIINNQSEGPFNNTDSRNDSDRFVQNGIHYQPEHGEMNTHPRRKSNPNTDVAMVTSDHNSLQIDQNGHNYSVTSGQLIRNKQQQNFHPSASVLCPQKSVFDTIGHNHNSGSSFDHDQVHEFGMWDTDVENLPDPQRQGGRSLICSPYSVHQSLDTVARFSLTRSGSTSSSEPHNASYTSSEVVTPFANHRGGLPHSRDGHYGNLRWDRFPSHEPGYSADHRFDTQQFHQQQHYNLQHKYNNQEKWQQESSVLGKEQHYAKNKVQIQSHRQPHINIRRCQSMVERQRTQPFLRPSSSRNTSYQQDNAGVFYGNIRALHAEKNIHNYETKILNSGIPSLGRHGNLISSSCNKITLQKGHQGCQNFEGQNRSIPNEPTLLFKKVPVSEIAGYVGVVKLADSSDSDDFAETVI